MSGQSLLMIDMHLAIGEAPLVVFLAQAATWKNGYQIERQGSLQLSWELPL